MTTKLGLGFAMLIAILLTTGFSNSAEASAQIEDCHCTPKNQSASREFKKLKLAAKAIAKKTKEEAVLRCEAYPKYRKISKPWEDIVLSEISRPHFTYSREGSADIIKLCPNFSVMKLEEKNQVWVSILHAMAALESSCDSSSEGDGPNGDLIGILQFHKGKEKIYSNGCRNGDGYSTERSLRCGLSMLNDQLRRGEPFFSKKSYFDVLRPQGVNEKFKQIKTVIAHHPGCKGPRAPKQKLAVAQVAPPKLSERVGAWWKHTYSFLQESLPKSVLGKVADRQPNLPNPTVKN